MTPLRFSGAHQPGTPGCELRKSLSPRCELAVAAAVTAGTQFFPNSQAGLVGTTGPSTSPPKLRNWGHTPSTKRQGSALQKHQPRRSRTPSSDPAHSRSSDFAKRQPPQEKVWSFCLYVCRKIAFKCLLINCQLCASDSERINTLVH